MRSIAFENSSALGEWHVVTPEYPPQTGGVSDYARLIADGLAADGCVVQVWCPSLRDGDGDRSVVEPSPPRVHVRRELGRFSPGDLRRAGLLLDARPGPRRLLVQYVPHGYGYRSANVAFCAWLLKRARVAGDRVEVVIHEPFLEFARWSWKRNAAAAAHRVMAAMLLLAARRVWVTTPAWGELLRPYALGRPVDFRWLPAPSTVPVLEDAALTSDVRGRYSVAAAGASLVVGHFGTYSAHVFELLEQTLPALLARRPEVSALLMGRGSAEARARLIELHPELGARLHATGQLPPRELSAHLAACDLMLQPFPDGVSCRRTSVMAALAHELPVATTRGRFTEPLWAESRAVALAPAGDTAALTDTAARLLADGRARASLARAGRSLYRAKFDVSNIVAALRGGDSPGRVGASLLTEEVKA
ncbi:MAG TPA: glycosyltransferase family 4 protein [Pyrinomonadaceae bacterium]